MIRPCQVADYWSLHLLDFDWVKLYESSAGFDWSSKSLNLIDWLLPMGCRWTIRSASPTDRIIGVVWMHLNDEAHRDPNLTREKAQNSVRIGQPNRGFHCWLSNVVQKSACWIYLAQRFPGCAIRRLSVYTCMPHRGITLWDDLTA